MVGCVDAVVTGEGTLCVGERLEEASWTLKFTRRGELASSPAMEGTLGASSCVTGVGPAGMPPSGPGRHSDPPGFSGASPWRTLVWGRVMTRISASSSVLLELAGEATGRGLLFSFPSGPCGRVRGPGSL